MPRIAVAHPWRLNSVRRVKRVSIKRGGTVKCVSMRFSSSQIKGKIDANAPAFSNLWSSGVDMAERILPLQGVITLYGYGVRLSVDRGHLVMEDGVDHTDAQGSLPVSDMD